MIARFDNWLRRLSADPAERRNAGWRIATGLVGSAGGVFVGGPVVQAFLVQAGLGAGQIGLHGSVGSAAGALGMLLLMGLADRVRRRARAVVLCSLVGCLDPALLLLLALLGGQRLGPSGTLAALIAAAALLQPVSSFLSMVHAGLTVRVLRPAILGRVSGVGGVLSGLVAMGLGLVVARILASTPQPHGYALCFAAALPLSVLTALSYGRLVELPQLARPPRGRASTPPWASLWEIFGLPQFRDLILPNVLRGLVSAVLFFAWVVGLQRLAIPVAYVGLAATVQAVSGSVVGSAVIALCADRWGPGVVIFGGSVLSAACLVAMVLTGSPEVFLALYGLLVLGAHLVGSGVPLGSYQIVPPELMGAYSGARLMLMSAAGALAMPVIGALLERVGPLPVFVAGAGLSLLMGVTYWGGLRRHHRPAPPTRPV